MKIILFFENYCIFAAKYYLIKKEEIEKETDLMRKKSNPPIIYNKIVISLRCSSEERNDMKWNELRRYAESKGWVLQRRGKKHDIYCHPNKAYTILIERHNAVEVKNGIMGRLLKQIG